MALQTFENEQAKSIGINMNQKRVIKVVVRRDIKDNYEIDFYTGQASAKSFDLSEENRIFLAQFYGLKI